MDEDFPKQPFITVAKKLGHTKASRVKKNDHFESEQALKNVNNIFHINHAESNVDKPKLSKEIREDDQKKLEQTKSEETLEIKCLSIEGKHADDSLLCHTESYSRRNSLKNQKGPAQEFYNNIEHEK